MVWTGDSRADLAGSIHTFFQQLNANHPNRSRISDGTIGDRDHQSRSSDHNPWYLVNGRYTVTACDITHDPGNGVDIDRLSDALIASRDPRIKYVIANGLIADSRHGWVWQPYSGINSHTKHLHLSIVASPICNDKRPWSALEGEDNVTPQDKDDIVNAVVHRIFNSSFPRQGSTQDSNRTIELRTMLQWHDHGVELARLQTAALFNRLVTRIDDLEERIAGIITERTDR